MYKEDELVKIKSIQKKLNSIFTIAQRHGGINKALEDEIEGQPAILMLLIAIAEQFNKLQKNNSILLDTFEDKDLKGIASVRNFIAHDYDGIRLSIISDTIRYKLPIILELINNILKESN
ncbi:MAG: HepT-like ribonuclease domain-containing protein [Campylobacterota bacterium]|nr:HepT-like ribonuclease domain-containing protein [Campylobacterota bacterium]